MWLYILNTYFLSLLISCCKLLVAKACNENYNGPKYQIAGNLTCFGVALQLGSYVTVTCVGISNADLLLEEFNIFCMIFISYGMVKKYLNRSGHLFLVYQ